MPEFLVAMMDKYAKLSLAKKLGYPLALATLVSIMTVASLWMKQPDFRVLFTSLSEADASRIVEMLESKKVPYKLAAGGSVVKVPAGQLYRLRLETIGGGMVKGSSIGYEIFDKNSLGVTEFVQKVNLKRALEGELARTIKGLREIDNARVHLVVPEKKLFSDKKEMSTASIVLKLAPSRKLSASQVNGIVMLVASSVEKLSSDHVTVIDSEGNVISKPMPDSEFEQSSNSQFAYQKKFEHEMDRKIESMLERFVGSKKVTARTNVLLDFSKVEQTEEKFDPDFVAVRSEQRNQESVVGGKTTGGIPGVASNQPSGASSGSVLKKEEKKKKSQTINYEISKTLSTTLIPSGSIKKLSVAVLVDGKHGTVENENGDKVDAVVPRTEAELNQIRGLVEKAMGYDESRGDQLEVVSIAFASEQVEEVFEKPSIIEKVMPFMPVARLLVFALIMIIVFFSGVKPLLNDILQQKLPEPVQNAPVTAADALNINMLDKHSLGAISKQEIIKIAKENPQQTALLLKQWLSKDQ